MRRTWRETTSRKDSTHTIGHYSPSMCVGLHRCTAPSKTHLHTPPHCLPPISGSRVYLPTPCVLPGDDCDYRARCLWLGRLLPRTQGAPRASGLRADPSRETMIFYFSSDVCIQVLCVKYLFYLIYHKDGADNPAPPPSAQPLQPFTSAFSAHLRHEGARVACPGARCTYSRT